MKGRGWPIAVLATALGVGCAHTKTTDQGAAESDNQDGGTEEAKATKPEARWIWSAGLRFWTRSVLRQLF